MLTYSKKDIVKAEKQGVDIENYVKIKYMYLNIRDNLIKKGISKPKVYGIARKIANSRARKLGWIE